MQIPRSEVHKALVWANPSEDCSCSVTTLQACIRSVVQEGAQKHFSFQKHIEEDTCSLSLTGHPCHGILWTNSGQQQSGHKCLQALAQGVNLQELLQRGAVCLVTGDRHVLSLSQVRPQGSQRSLGFAQGVCYILQKLFELWLATGLQVFVRGAAFKDLFFTSGLQSTCN